MKYSIISAILITASLLSSSAFASTILEYEAQCKYTNANKVLKYSGKCHGNWGVVMQPNDTYYERYIITYPNGSEVWIYINSDGSTTVNNIKAVTIKAKKGYEKVQTVEGEIFEFTKAPE